MASELLSFRLSGSELEWLKNQQEEGETLNLTAKRILLGLMDRTVDTPVYTSVDTPVYTPVDTQTLKEEIKAEILETINELIQPIKEALIEDREKLGRLGDTVNDLVEKTVDSDVYTPVDTQVDIQIDTQVDIPDKPLESNTIVELRAMAKGLGIPFKSRDNKEKLIKLISDRKSLTPQHHEP